METINSVASAYPRLSPAGRYRFIARATKHRGEEDSRAKESGADGRKAENMASRFGGEPVTRRSRPSAPASEIYRAPMGIGNSIQLAGSTLHSRSPIWNRASRIFERCSGRVDFESIVRTRGDPLASKLESSRFMYTNWQFVMELSVGQKAGVIYSANAVKITLLALLSSFNRIYLSRLFPRNLEI